MDILPATSVDSDGLDFLAQCLVDAFGHAYPAWTVAAAKGELTNAVGLPISVVAKFDGELIGCASLLADDEIATFAHASPWLGNVFVAPSYRSKGAGRALVAEIIAIARALGFEALHLQTETAQDWYGHEGWIPLGTVQVNGHPATIMRLPL